MADQNPLPGSERERTSARGEPSQLGKAYRPISVIIPTYNRRQWLDEILDSIALQSLSVDQFEVIVVDDGSQDDTREIVQKEFPFPLRYFYQTNQGDAAARNLGAKESQAEFLVFLDDDIILEKDFLANLVAEHRSQPNRIIVGYDTLWIEESNPMTVGAVPPAPPVMEPDLTPIPFADVCSNNMSIRREAYFAIGMMEGLDFPGSSMWCDVDFAYRAFQKNFVFLQSRRALCWHRDYVAKSLQARKKRMYQVAYRAVVLFQKYPDLLAYIPMFSDKTPVDRRQDSLSLKLKKFVRRMISVKPMLILMEKVFEMVQDHPSLKGLAEVLARWIAGGYLFRGYRDGLRDFGPVQSPVNSSLVRSMEKNI